MAAWEHFSFCIKSGPLLMMETVGSNTLLYTLAIVTRNTRQPGFSASVRADRQDRHDERSALGTTANETLTHVAGISEYRQVF
jgi:hypothetical protein